MRKNRSGSKPTKVVQTTVAYFGKGSRTKSSRGRRPRKRGFFG